MKIFSYLTSLSLLLFAAASPSFADTVCDFDGDGLSEIGLVNLNSQGSYDWTAFNPRTGQLRTVIDNFGDPSAKLIPGNWFQKGRAVAAIVNPVTADEKGRATWIGRSVDYLGGTSISRKLGRSGDIIIQGGDYNGNGITDSLILKKTTGKLGLRVDYFLSSYNGDKLGEERLYRALGSPFRDWNFFFSPDGVTDHLAVLRSVPGDNRAVLKLKPFTDTPQAFQLGAIPAGSRGPYPLKQDSGAPDLLAFYARRQNNTLLTVKSLSGATVYRRIVPGNGTVMVGDYLEYMGWEIAVEDGEAVTIINPQSGVSYRTLKPVGQVVSCVSNQSID
jgi:hypothetical protein